MSFIFGMLTMFILCIPIHFRLTRKQYAAFMSACAELRRERQIRERQGKTIRNVQALLHRSRHNFGESAPLPAVADAGQRPLTWQRQAQSQTVAGPVMRARPRVF